MRSVVNNKGFQQKHLWPHLDLGALLLNSPFFAGLVSSYKSAVSEAKAAADPNIRRQAKSRAVQLLSLAAPHFPYAVIQETFDCSDRTVYNARLHAAHNGAGEYVPEREKRHYKSRLPLETLVHFREFKSRDDVVTSVAYTRADKTQTIEKFQLQDNVQDLFQKYLRECKLLNLKPIGVSAFEKIFYTGEYVNKTARTCVCHQDLFYGTENFEAMESFVITVTDILREQATSRSSTQAGLDGVIPLYTSTGLVSAGLPVIQGLRESLLAILKRVSTYYRTDFNVHAQLESTCATHCIQYALSSSTDPCFRTTCAHEHTMSCPDCNLATHLLQELHCLLKSARDLHALSELELERLSFALEESESRLSKYIGHRVRTIHQNAVPGKEISDMGYTEAYIILDYMNKWLPHKHLATTSDAFGQAGESVHGATVYVRALPVETKEMIARGEVEDPQKFLRELPVDMEGDINRWYVLLGATNDHKQDQWHASSVTEATLKIVKEFEPQVETARLRSDNASCYHGTLYWLMLSNMETSTGIKVTECGMNEAGEGKDETDSSFNTAKAYVRRLVNLGKIDANTAVDFIAALNSGHGILGMIARTITIARPASPLDLGTLEQITRFSHFRHEEGGLRCWEQHKIGEGRLFTHSDVKKLKKQELPATTGVMTHQCGEAQKPEVKVKDGRRALDLQGAKREDRLRRREAKAAAVEASVSARREIIEANRTTVSCPHPGCRHAPFLTVVRMERHAKRCNPTPLVDQSLRGPSRGCRSYRPEIDMDIAISEPPEAALRYESTDHRHLGEEYNPYGCEPLGLDMPLLLADVEVGDSACGGKWTYILNRPRCDTPRKGYAMKARVTPQQKTEEQIKMLEAAFQLGLERGAGRSSRDSDQDVMNAINAVSAPQKQLRLDQITSWFSRRYSKYVLEGKNARVRAEIELALAQSESAANTEMEMVSEDTQGEGQREPVTAGVCPPNVQQTFLFVWKKWFMGLEGSWVRTNTEGATAAQAVAPQQVATRPDAPPAASNRRLENEQAKQRAVAAKRKAIFDASQENFAALKSLSPGGRAGYVKKLKVGPLKGLLMHFQDCADELPVGKKADFLASVLSFVEKMETSVAPTSGDMEMHGVPPVQQPQAQDANVIVACDPEVNRTETSVKARRSGATYVPKIANAEFPRDSESSKYYCKVMRAPAAMNNICNNLTRRKTHPRGWSVQRMKVPSALFILCWAMQFKAAAAVTIENHSDYQECIQTNCSRLYIFDDSLMGTVPTQLGELTQLTYLYIQDMRITGTVPTQMGALTQLIFLNFAENSLTGTVPTQMGALTQLTYLRLDYNSLTGTVPTQMGALTQLVNLRLDSNSLTGTVPTQMGALTQLTYFKTGFLGTGIFIANILAGTVPTQMGLLTQLVELYLHDNSLTGTVPTQMGALAQLYHLDLEDLLLTGTVPTQMGALTQLTTLDLEDLLLTGTVPTQMGALTQLTTLYLSSNSLTGTVPTQMGTATRLFYLHLSGNKLTGTVPTEIGALTDLNEM
ncbi:hypothetical protein CYMTET_43550 [Cymbomonas tetramitiformis]|uniref:Disease resistance R13L4/SHOC-2-like LRR domain-containing protein n=1 Tax=Cymbomonas tetramitiformis TaxID=36881 RepID=A0AAE0F0I4_9CHLO|nr:hypothetical protein CYMTET_43550 [Cymbomonas tetramitiformis]